MLPSIKLEDSDKKHAEQVYENVSKWEVRKVQIKLYRVYFIIKPHCQSNLSKQVYLVPHQNLALFPKYFHQSLVYEAFNDKRKTTGCVQTAKNRLFVQLFRTLSEVGKE